jgi:hypothetical protein
MRMLVKVEVQALYIEPGSPREYGYVESFNCKFRGRVARWRGLIHAG